MHSLSISWKIICIFLVLHEILPIYESNHFLHVQLNFLLSMDIITVKEVCKITSDFYKVIN